MAGKTRSSSTADDFTKHLDNYIKNSEAFKNAIVSAVHAAVFPLQEEITNLKDQLAKLMSELNEVKVKANSNEQYSRRNSVRIFGLNKEERENCYDKVLNLCQNELEIQVRRDELDRAHRVDKPREAEVGSGNSPTRAMIVKLCGYGTKLKFMKARWGLRSKQIYINEDLTKVNHDFLLRVKKSCIDGVAVYTVDGNVMARCSTTKRVYRIDKIDDLKSHGFFQNSSQHSLGCRQC